jgi:uncharacterized protein
MTVTVEWGGEPLALLPQRAACLVRQRVLLVADVHIGKAASFRRLGVPVPGGTTGEMLQLLTRLVRATDAGQVIFLGDFLHSAQARSEPIARALQAWRGQHAGVAMTLVRGNHDAHAGDPPAQLGFEVVDEPLQLGSLALCHHPEPRPGAAVLAGHSHPCVRLGGRANDRLRLPCFHFRDGVGVLPAFGAFTGMHPIERRAADRVFAVTDDTVVAVP